jgi:hypothetical protein
MCFNSGTSLLSFSISFICFAYLLYCGIKNKNKNDIFLSVLIILIGLMQVIELFLWRNQKCNSINHYLSLSIIVLLYSQVTIISILYLILYPGKKPVFSDNFVIITIILFTILTGYTLNFLNKKQLCSKPKEYSCRLVWDVFVKLNDNYFLFMTFLFFYFSFLLIITMNSLYSNDLLTKYPLRYLLIPVTWCIAYIYVLFTSNLFKEFIDFLKHKSPLELYKRILLVSSANAFGTAWCFLSIFIGIIGILRI